MSQVCAAILLAVVMLTSSCTGFLHDKEVEIIGSEWRPVVVVVRHVEYVGVIDNGTLVCSVPGFTKYRWAMVNVASKEGYGESYMMETGDKIPESQSELRIDATFPFVNDLMVVTCEAMLGLHPRMKMIWVITRLHSPLGYPTDPSVCDYGSQSYDTNCTWYQWTYSTDCYYNKGLDYTGGLSTAMQDKKCKYWHMKGGPHPNSHKLARLMGWYTKGGHDYCRNIPINPTCFLKHNDVDKCRDRVLSQPWCYSDTEPTEGEYRVHYCGVRQCSDCMYGSGGSKFSLYPGRKFPPYLGRSIATKRSGVYCLQGVGWEDNVCRTELKIKTKDMHEYYTVVKSKPHCYVVKKGADTKQIKTVPNDNLELVECKIPQCTVRQVWFLFFNTFGDAFIHQSNFKGVKVILVRGRKEERIKFGAFGIHRPEGLKLGSEDYRLSEHVKSFKLVARRPPDRLSEIIIPNVQSAYSGKYSLTYRFPEADPAVDLAVYRANFELDVKEPTSFSLTPSVLRVCRKGKGKFNLLQKGHFDILEDSLVWYHGRQRKKAEHVITPENIRFELTANAKGLVVKSVTRPLWVRVTGRTYSGRPSAHAQVVLKDQPLLKAISPLTQYSLPGDVVTITIETDQLQPVTWVFDAMVIGSLPDDPDMGFRRVPRGESVVTSLVVSDLKEHHYGSYSVTAVLNGCQSKIQFNVRHTSENTDLEEGSTQVGGGTPAPLRFNRTGLWCTDELDPYALYFAVRFPSEMTISAYRNEPLSLSNVPEVHFYTLSYSRDRKTWTNTTLKGKQKIPYVTPGKEAHEFPVPFTTRHLRIYPETPAGKVACMKLRLFGCTGKTLGCSESVLKTRAVRSRLGILIGVPLGSVAALALAILLYFGYMALNRKRQRERKRMRRKKRRRITYWSSEDESSDAYRRRARKKSRYADSQGSRDKRRRHRKDGRTERSYEGEYSDEYREGRKRKHTDGSFHDRRERRRKRNRKQERDRKAGYRERRRRRRGRDSENSSEETERRRDRRRHYKQSSDEYRRRGKTDSRRNDRSREQRRRDKRRRNPQ